MYKVVVSFKTGSFKSNIEALNFAIENLHFNPRTIQSQKSFSGDYYEFKKEKTIENFSINNDDMFRIADDVYFYGDELNDVLYREDRKYEVQYFIFGFEALNNYWLDNLINRAHEKNFFFAYYVDKFKPLWQSEIFINHFIQNNKSHSHLNLKMHWHPTWSNIFNQEVIDIFQNPGHEVLTYITWIMTAPEMWFGKDALEFFNKERLLSYLGAKHIQEILKDLVYIKLFDVEEADYETNEVLVLQADFRERSGMNVVEKKLNELIEDNNKMN